MSNSAWESMLALTESITRRNPHTRVVAMRAKPQPTQPFQLTADEDNSVTSRLPVFRAAF